MKKKITGRDMKFFLLGLLTFFLIELVWNWDNNVKDFMDGFKGANKTNSVK
jgi:hypothetical protein